MFELVAQSHTADDEQAKWIDADTTACMSLVWSGRIVDPYSQQMVDCSSTIFLLTTNVADSVILEYWREHKESLRAVTGMLEPSALLRKLKPLERQIKAAVAGRTSVSLLDCG
jgi:hypothetical protein